MVRKAYKDPFIALEQYMEIYNGLSEEGFTSVSSNTKITGIICPICGLEFSKRSDEFRKKNFSMLCKVHNMEKTYMEKYGVSNPNKLESIKAKARSTCIERYGVDSTNKLESMKAKSKATCLKKYGVDNYKKTKECDDKIKATCMERYGVDSTNKLESMKAKSKATCLEKYGVDNYRKTKECEDKIKNTCMERYGAEHYSQTIEAHKHRKSHIFYNGEYFDSYPELEFFKKCISEGKEIIRHPISFQYESEGNIHIYFPDFEVDGVLIEIKGIQFFNEATQKWKNPYDPSMTPKEEAKYDCAIAHGVKIIYVKS